jgi:putative Mn2+ efflux pump MntP
MESGGRQEINAYGSGFYAWMAAVLIAWLGLFILTRSMARERREAGGQ